MKNIIILLFVFVLLFSISVAAQEENIANAGTMPDNLFWGLDVFFDKISLALTSGDVERAEKALEIAQERLLEIKAMIEENKLDAAEKAKAEHGKFLSNVEQNIDRIKEDNSTEEIKKVVKVEKKLEEHDQEVEQIFGELKIKIEVEREITQQQKDLVDSILNSLKGQTGEVEIKIENKKNKIKVKIKQETGKSEKEIESEIEDIEDKESIEKDEKAFEAINDAEKEFNKFLKKAEKKNISVSQDLINQFNLLLKNAKTQSEQGNFIEAKKLAKQAEKLIDREKEGNEELEEEKEIEVETEEGKTKIDIKINREKLKFEMNTTDLDTIINEISDRTGLSKNEINSIIKVDNKDKQEQEKEFERENEKEEDEQNVEKQKKKSEDKFKDKGEHED